MANIQILPYAQQIAAIQRQRKLADLLQEQSMQPSATQMVSGIAIPTSPWETASKLAQSLAGAYAQSRSDKEEAAAEQQQREEAKKSIQDFIAASGPQKAYTSTPVMEQSSDEDRTEMAPKMQWSDETGQMEPVLDWKETFKPGLSRNEQIAKLLEMQMSGNKNIAAIAPTLAGLLPKAAEGEIGAVNPADWTPESLAKYKTSGSYSDLAPVTKAKTPTTFEQEWELFKKENPQGTLADFKKLGSSSTNVNVALPPAQGKYAEKVGTSLAEREDATLAASETAPDQIASAHRIKGILQQNPITGAGAEFKLGAKKLAVMAGLADPNDSEIVATDNLISELAKGTLAAVKSSGLGTGNGFTDKDVVFLQKATTGNVELSNKTLEYLIEKQERAARESIKKGNTIRARRRSMPEFKGLSGAFEDIPMPAEYNSASPYGLAPEGAVRQRG